MQVQFLLVFLVIEVCGDAIVGNAFWEEVCVTFLTGTVEDDVGRVLFCALRLEIEVFFVVKSKIA